MRIVAETIEKRQFKKIGEFEIPDSQFSELLGTFGYRSRYELAMKLAQERFPNADIRSVTIYEEISKISETPTERIRSELSIRSDKRYEEARKYAEHQVDLYESWVRKLSDDERKEVIEHHIKSFLSLRT